MSDFVNLPILKRLNKRNPISRIEKLEARTDVGPSARVAALSELSQDIGEQSAGIFKCVDPSNGVIRGYMTSTPRPEAPGYHLAFFDNSGRMQFGVSADDGSAVFGAGAGNLSKDGFILYDAGDAIELRDSTYKQHLHIYLDNGKARIQDYWLSSEINLISNGDFETGDFTGWTETDPDGVLSVVQVDGSYVARFSGTTIANYTANYIRQNASGLYGCVVSFRCKADVNGLEIQVSGSGGEIKSTRPYTEWRNVLVVLENATTYMQINVLTGAGHTVWIDDVVVREGFFAEYVEMNSGNINLGAPRVNLIGALLESHKGATINSTKQDTDTEIYGTAATPVVSVDASTNRAGIDTSSPATKLDINDDSVRVRTAKTPANAGDTGVTGQICWDANYIYICTATNTWKRAAIGSW